MTTAELKRAVCEAVDAMRVALLTEAVERHDLAVTRGAYGLNTTFESEFGPKDVPCVATLAEHDALPEIGHACGHNLERAKGFEPSTPTLAGKRVPKNMADFRHFFCAIPVENASMFRFSSRFMVHVNQECTT